MRHAPISYASALSLARNGLKPAPTTDTLFQATYSPYKYHPKGAANTPSRRSGGAPQPSSNFSDSRSPFREFSAAQGSAECHNPEASRARSGRCITDVPWPARVHLTGRHVPDHDASLAPSRHGSQSYPVTTQPVTESYFPPHNDSTRTNTQDSATVRFDKSPPSATGDLTNFSQSSITLSMTPLKLIQREPTLIPDEVEKSRFDAWYG